MKVDEIRLLYEYNFWANQRILTACARLTSEQYVAPVAYESLRVILVHLLDSNWSWRTAFTKYFVGGDSETGDIPTGDGELWDIPEITPKEVPDFEMLIERWKAEEQAMRSFLNELTDQKLRGYIRYRVPEGYTRQRILWQCLLHVANHATQHRAEAAMILTGYGQSPGDVDFTLFLNHHLNLPMT